MVEWWEEQRQRRPRRKQLETCVPPPPPLLVLLPPAGLASLQAPAPAAARAHPPTPATPPFLRCRDALVAYNSLLHFLGSGNGGTLQDALGVYRGMQRDGPTPDIGMRVCVCGGGGGGRGSDKPTGSTACTLPVDPPARPPTRPPAHPPQSPTTP